MASNHSPPASPVGAAPLVGWEAVLEGCASHRLTMESYRVVIVGDFRAGKRALASRLRDALVDISGASQIGGRVHHQNRHPGAGIDHFFAEVRIPAATSASGQNTTGASTSSSSASAPSCVEIFVVDSPRLLKVVIPTEGILQRTSVVVAVDLSEPTLAMASVEKWRDAINSVAVSLMPTSPRGGQRQQSSSSVAEKPNSIDAAKDLQALVAPLVVPVANKRWTDGVSAFGPTAAHAATEDSTPISNPATLRTLHLEGQLPFAVPAVVVATKVDLATALDRYDRVAAEMCSDPAAPGGGKARALTVIVQWLRHQAMATRAAFAIAPPHTSSIQGVDSGIARYLLYCCGVDRSPAAVQVINGATTSEMVPGALLPLGHDVPSNLLKHIRLGKVTIDGIIAPAEGKGGKGQGDVSGSVIIPHQSAMDAVEKKSTSQANDFWASEFGS